MKRFVQMVLCTILMGTTLGVLVMAAEADITGGMVFETEAAIETETEIKIENETENITEADSEKEETAEIETEKEIGEISQKTLTANPGCTEKELQELLDVNADGTYELKVVIPKGTYELNRTLYVYPNTTIVATDAKLVKQRVYGAMLEAKLIADDGGYDANYNITVDGGMWDSEPVRTGRMGTETFRFIHCNNITIKNATLCNVPEGSHLVVFAGVQNGRISNCKFYGYGTDWTQVNSLKEAVQLDIVHSSVQVPTQQEKEILNWDDLPCDKIIISGCEFFQYSRGVGSHTAVAGRFHSNVTIENNVFSNLSDSAIRLYNYKDTVVKGNKINNAVAGVMAYTYIETSKDNSYFEPNNKVVSTLPTDYNIQITGNVISNIKKKGNSQGDGIRVRGSDTRPLSGVKITGNTISVTERCGIFVTAAPHILIAGKNQISTTQSDAICVNQGSGLATIYNNTITYTNGDGISVKASIAASVYSNWVSYAAGSGIYLFNSNNCVVGGMDAGNGNVITGSGKHGIWVAKDCNYVQIRQNKISDYARNAKAYGIYVLRSSGNLTNPLCVQSNTITGLGYSTGKDGIRIGESLYVTISGNRITAAKGSGILVNMSKYCTVGKSSTDYNIISKPTERGISFCKKSDGGKIQYNKIVDSAGDGIRLADSKTVRIYENTISARTNGISIISKSKQADVRKNVVEKYGKTENSSGIYVSQSGGTKALNTKIVENTIRGANKKNTNQGIHIRDASHTLVQLNEIRSATGNGIYLYASADSKVSVNDVWKAKKHGIYLHSSKKCTVVDNGITSVKENGIYLHSSKQCSVRDNAVYDPDGFGIYITENSKNAKIIGNVVSDARKISIVVNNAPGSVVKGSWITADEVEEQDKQTGIRIAHSDKSKVTSNILENVKLSEEVVVVDSLNCENYSNDLIQKNNQ